MYRGGFVLVSAYPYHSCCQINSARRANRVVGGRWKIKKLDYLYIFFLQINHGILSLWITNNIVFINELQFKNMVVQYNFYFFMTYESIQLDFSILLVTIIHEQLLEKWWVTTRLNLGGRENGPFCYGSTQYVRTGISINWKFEFYRAMK